MSGMLIWLRHQSMLLLGTWRSDSGLAEMTFSRDLLYAEDSLTDRKTPARGRWNVSHETVRLIEADGQVYDLDLKFEGPNRLLACGPKSKVRWERDAISRFTDPQ